MNIEAGGDGDDERFTRATPVTAAVEEIDILTDIECGFRMEMFTGTVGDIEVTASSGGGCGSPWLTFSIGERHFRLDAREVARDLVAYLHPDDDGEDVPS